MINLIVIVTVVLLLVACVIVVLVTSLQSPQQGEILLRTGFGKTKFSSTPKSKLLCLPGLHACYTIDNAVKRLQISNVNQAATDTADGLSVFYTCECEYKVDISADTLMLHVVEDNSSNVESQIISRTRQLIRQVIRQSNFESLRSNQELIDQSSLTTLNSKLKSTGFYAVLVRIDDITLEPSDGINGNSANYRYLEQAKEEKKRQDLLKEHQASIDTLKTEIQDFEKQLSNQLNDTKSQQQQYFQQVQAKSDETARGQVRDAEASAQQRQRKAVEDANAHQIKQKRQLEAKLSAVQSENEERLQQIDSAASRREQENARKQKLQMQEEIAKRETAMQQIDSETESQMSRFQNDDET